MLATWHQSLSDDLRELESLDALRHLRILERDPGKTVRWEGRTLLNCSSNDYLGLSQDAFLLKTFYQTLSPETALPHFGLGATSSRLLAGNHPAYTALESSLARAYHREAALVFNSGYHANVGILPALVGPQDAIFSDRLNHASLLDGARLAGAKFFRYPHLDLNHLEHLLHKHRSHYRRAILASESVFSMDGDLADLNALSSLRDRYDLFLYVDEAHAVGVFGNQGLGLSEAQAVIPKIDLLLGTFGKAWGGMGAYAICDQVVYDTLVNKARPLIFSTGLPPVVVHWNHFILERMSDWTAQRCHVLSLAEHLRVELRVCGLTTRGQSQIVPVIIGSNQDTVNAAQALMDAGLLLLPIRPPTVPMGSARLRISLSAAMDWNVLQALPQTIQTICKRS